MKYTFDTLLTDLGKAEAVAYVRFALPRLQERNDALSLLLAQEKWTDGTILAHKLLGSIKMYDDGSLEPLLNAIEVQDLEIIRDPRFAQDLQEAFKRIFTGIEAWLLVHE